MERTPRPPLPSETYAAGNAVPPVEPHPTTPRAAWKSSASVTGENGTRYAWVDWGHTCRYALQTLKILGRLKKFLTTPGESCRGWVRYFSGVGVARQPRRQRRRSGRGAAGVIVPGMDRRRRHDVVTEEPSSPLCEVFALASTECPSSVNGTAVSLGTAANTSAMPGSASINVTQCWRRAAVI